MPKTRKPNSNRIPPDLHGISPSFPIPCAGSASDPPQTAKPNPRPPLQVSGRYPVFYFFCSISISPGFPCNLSHGNHGNLALFPPSTPYLTLWGRHTTQ
jgi:hypothetical protein